MTPGEERSVNYDTWPSILLKNTHHRPKCQLVYHKDPSWEPQERDNQGFLQIHTMLVSLHPLQLPIQSQPIWLQPLFVYWPTEGSLVWDLDERHYFDDSDSLTPISVGCNGRHLLPSNILSRRCLQTTLLPSPDQRWDNGFLPLGCCHAIELEKRDKMHVRCKSKLTSRSTVKESERTVSEKNEAKRGKDRKRQRKKSISWPEPKACLWGSREETSWDSSLSPDATSCLEIASQMLTRTSWIT